LIKPSIGFLLGKPPKDHSIIADALTHLPARGITTQLHLPHQASPVLPDWIDEVNLVVHRGLKREVLEALTEASPHHFINPLGASLTIPDRLWLYQALISAGLPTPATTAAKNWTEVTRQAAQRQVVIKAQDGWRGRGSGVLLDTPLPQTPPFAGPFVVQDYVPNNGIDHKLYVIGKKVYGLFKQTRRDGSRVAAAFSPGPHLTRLAMGVGLALNLMIYGVDVLVNNAGHSIIDVNPFPGFRGVTGASKQLSNYLVTCCQQRAS
jgi:ribosomal protein S6--L-glutamate ligase